MKYMGSKRRIVKYILPIILKDRKPGQYYVEPFVGGANMIDKVDGERIGGDSNDYLIDMWKSLQKGWIPPDYISEKDWKDVRDKMDDKYSKAFISFVRLGCSFGADWNGGYARNVRKDIPNSDILNMTTKSYCAQSKRNILKQVPELMGVTFVSSSYLNLEFPSRSLIYCDPPYQGTTKYMNPFDHNEFFSWCRAKSRDGHKIFVSEYNAPYDFSCVWEGDTKRSLNNFNGKTSISNERLFTILN